MPTHSMMMEYKDAEPGNDSSAAAQVAREIKAIGGDVKALADDVNRRLKEFQDKLDASEKSGLDAVKAEELNKLRTEVLSKADALEAANTKRLDQIETAMKRKPLGGDGSEAEVKELAQFERQSLRGRNADPGKAMAPGQLVNLDDYKQYKAAYAPFLRRGKDVLPADGVKALSVGSDPDGGYYVTPQIHNTAITIITESSPLRAVAQAISISSDSLVIPEDIGFATCEWVGETAPRGETGTPTVGSREIKVHELAAKPKATQRLLEDAGIDIEQWLAKKVGDAMAIKQSTAFMVGDGQKSPRGILTYPAGTAWGQIEQINTGSATGVDYEGLIRISTSLKEFYHARASWLMRRSSVADCMLLKDGDGRYIFAVANEKAGFPMSLMGYSLRMAADMPAFASGALGIAFGDFYSGYTIVDRLGMSVLRDPFTADPFVVFKTRLRVGGDVTNFEAIKLGKCATRS